MTRPARIFSAAASTAIALGMLIVGASPAFADQYPRNWRVKSTELPAPLYDFLPGHNGRTATGGAAAQNSVPVVKGPARYDFTPGSSTFHRAN